MAVISSVLAIIGLIILTVAVFALIGAGSTASALGLGEGLTTVLTSIGSVIASYWEVFAALFTIGLIAYVARGSGRNGSAVDTAIGAAEGATKALADDDDSRPDPAPEPTPDPEPDDSDPETSTSTGSDDGGGGGDTDISVTQMQQQQQQMMQQLVQAIVMGNMSQNPSGTYIMQQQQQQMMGAGLFSGISPSVYRTFINNIDNSSNEQIINQFLEFIQVNDIDEIDDRVLVQFMKQVLNINVDLDIGGTGNGDVIVQINQIIQHIDITIIEQNIEKIVSEVDITNNQFIFIEQFIAILFSLEEGDYTNEGDTIIIDTTGLNIDVDITVQIEASVLINFLTIMKVIKYWELKKLLVELVEMHPEKTWNVKIEQLIIIYRESDSGDKGESKGLIIQIDDVQSEINTILSQIRESESLESESIQDKREAIKKLRDAFNKLQNNPEILKAIAIAADANAGQEKGTQSLAVAIQRGLNDTNLDITDIAKKADEVDQVWREIAEAERLIKESFNNDMTIYKSLEKKEYEINQIAEMHKKFKEGINEIQKLDK